jgi:glycine/D-amino acid oxidase-like deaminating enzyme
MKTVIVGGGVMGVALAYRLVTEGVEVELFEAGRLGGGASGVGIGWLNSHHKEPFAYHLLNVSGMAEHATLAREFAGAPWYHPGGHLEWTTPDRTDRLVARVEHLRSWGYPAELLSPRRVGELEPFLRIPAGVTRVASFPWEGLADLPQLIGVLAHAAVTRGAVVRTFSPVDSLTVEGGQVTGVQLPDGTHVGADVVAVCAGRWSDALMATAGLDLPMAPTPGFNIYTGPAPVTLTAMVHAPDVNFRPEGAGRILARSAEFDDAVALDDPVDPVPEVGREILARAARYLPGLEGAAIEGARVALRPIPADSLPAVGTVPGRPGLYLIVTHSGGTMGPLLGRLAALEIAHGELDPRLEPFRPARLTGAGAAGGGPDPSLN